MEKSPYVISAELDLDSNNIAPFINRNKLDDYRTNLDTSLRRMGKDTCWVSSSEIVKSLKRNSQNTNLPLVNLDDRYITDADQYLGISRGINADLNDESYAPRIGYAPLAEQLGRVSNLGDEITIVDDVLFSGEMITWLNNKLSMSGTSISSVIVGIAIQEGIDKLAGQGIDVYTDNVFSSVEDELCERDLAFVPGSGRRIINSNVNALYFDVENGKPEQWASIDQDASTTFCISSLERSLQLLKPQTSIRSIGRFRGYKNEGTVADTLNARLGELR